MNLAFWWPRLSPTPPWSVLLSQEQKCTGHPSTLFLGGRGGGGEVPLVNRALEEIIPKLNIQGAFFLTFLSKIVGVVFSDELCLQQANLH